MFAANGYYAAQQAATPGYTPTPGAPVPVEPETPGGGGPYEIGLWGRPMFPLSAVRTSGGYGPIISTPSPVIILPPMPPLMDYVQIQPRGKSPKGK
jgi:hypothetical protein